MKSIFELENRLDISKEYSKILFEIYEDDEAMEIRRRAIQYRTNDIN